MLNITDFHKAMSDVEALSNTGNRLETSLVISNEDALVNTS